MRAKGRKSRRAVPEAAEVSSDGASLFSSSPSASSPSAALDADRQASLTGGTGPTDGQAGPPGPPGPAGDAPKRQRRPVGDESSPPAGRIRRRALKNWRVRSRLLLLVAIPTLTALVFGGFGIYSSVRSAQTYQRVEQLATLGKDATVLAQALENERDQTAFYIALGTGGGRAAGLSGDPSVRANAAPQLTSLRQQYAVTDRAATTVSGMAAQITSGYPAQTQQAATAMLEAVTKTSLDSLRSAATGTQLPLLVVLQKYGQTIDTVLAFNSDIGQGAGDPTLAQSVDALGLVLAMQADASQQRAILAAALNQGSFTPAELTTLQNSVASEQTSLQAFDAAATSAQLQLWNSTASRSDYGLANSEEQQALSLAAASGPSESLSSDPTTPDDWYSGMSNTIRYQMGSVARNLVDAVIARASVLRRNAITTAAIVGAVVLIVLTLAMLFTIIVGRSMVRPLRRLRTDALGIADVQLPGMVRQLSESDGEEGDLQIQPVGVDSTDEIGEVARAFDQVHAEAVRLASNEARLRGNVNAMFVNLSRRSQSLVERQIRLIDDLEQGEQDSDRLGSLFRLDHLATRMRRNSENLLVLAGHEAARRWTQPVALVDVLRAAVSEIEHYERVVLNVQPGIAVRGQVVNDVVHLLAELIENATAFSSAQTPVNVSGHLLNSGGVLLDITDQGVGMAADEMAHSNWRLDNPPMVDVSVSRRMGLFVVARLASRHGIRVRLRPAPAGGLTALMWLPDETVTHEASGLPSGLRRFSLGDPGDPGPLESLEILGHEDLGGRSAAEAAVAAARTPRFTAIDPDAGSDLPEVPEQAGGPNGGEPWPAREGEALPPLPVRGGPPLPGRGAEPRLPGAGVPPEAGNGTFPSRRGGPWPELGGEPLPVRGNGSFAGGLPGGAPAAGPAGEAEPVLGAPDGLVGDPASPLAGPSAGGNVIVPQAQAAEDGRLPIFESVESDWFRRGRHYAGQAAEDDREEIAASWTSPVDEGWRAAEAVEEPSTAGLTAAGLPRRVPQANLVPGSVPETEPAEAPDLVRSAAATRHRMASFQRGSRQGREVLQTEDAPDGEDADGS